MKENIPSEHIEQVQLVSWFRKTFPEVLIFAIPNGGSRNIATAVKLKSEGVHKGIPDLFVPSLKLWVEMKRIKCGRLSRDQESVIRYLFSCGYHVIVGFGFDDAKCKILEFIKKNEILGGF